MVTGFSLILYSRLHLITSNTRLLRGVLCTILTNGFLFHTPVVVSGFMHGELSAKLYKYSSMFEIVFVVQEITLSTLYIVLFRRFVREHNHSTFSLLIVAQGVILLCDVPLLVLLYLDYFLPRMMILCFTYALKTRIEFLVLNRLRKGARNALTRHLAIYGDEWDSESPPRLDVEEASANSTISDQPCEQFEITKSRSASYHSTRVISLPGDRIVLQQHNGDRERDSLHKLERRYLGAFR